MIVAIVGQDARLSAFSLVTECPHKPQPYSRLGRHGSVWMGGAKRVLFWLILCSRGRYVRDDYGDELSRLIAHEA